MNQLNQSEIKRISFGVKDLLVSLDQVLLTSYRAPQTVELKSDGSIVTATDKECEAVLRTGLDRLLPNTPFLGEETAPNSLTHAMALLSGNHLWAVDPIDGTLNFTSQIPFFGCSVALLERQGERFVPVIGAITMPALNELHYTFGSSVRCRDRESGSEAVVERLHAKDGGKDTIILPGSFYKHFFLTEANKTKYNFRQFGCTMADGLFVALGRADATLTHAHLWDFAGAFAICRHLGVSFFDCESGAELLGFQLKDFAEHSGTLSWRLNSYCLITKPSSLKKFRALAEVVRPP
jgi:myo-inositol-1(or 4)-monophosphatase